VITSRAIDMAHLRAKEGANYVPRHLLTMSCNQSPLAPLKALVRGAFANRRNFKMARYSSKVQQLCGGW
jgi:hypothetical protein